MSRKKWLTTLICLLLFIAAVDTIPDPPAINPPTNHSSTISALQIQVSFTLLEKEWHKAVDTLRRVRVDWIAVRRAFDDEPAGIRPLPRVHQAADISPPTFS